MKIYSVKFSCTSCRKDIYRVTKQCDEITKKCAKCNSTSMSDLNSDTIPTTDIPESIKNDILYYYRRLERIIELARKDKFREATFFDLWTLTRGA